MLKGLFIGFGVTIMLLAALLFYRTYYVYCPCGFKHDPFTGGCVVDLNPPPCTDSSGNSPGSKSSAPGKQTVVSPPNPAFPPNCTIFVSNCAVRADWKAVQFTLVNGSGTVPIGAPPKQPVMLEIAEYDKNGGTCGNIKGEIEVPFDVPQTIPFDPVALSGSYPIGSSSTSGSPSSGLVANYNDGCRVGQVKMVAFPTLLPACGCKGPFFRG